MKFKSLLLFFLFVLVGLSFFSFELSFVLKQPLTYILIALIVLSFFMENNYLPSLTRYTITYNKAIIFILSAVMIGVLFGQNLQAKWGPIDDHEIMLYLGSDQKLSLTEIPQKLRESEVGAPGVARRYRPSYHLLRLLETSFWGNNPHLWYGCRLLLLLVSIALFWQLLKPWFGLIPSGLFLLYLLTYTMWADMFARLGPAETYCVLGLSLYLWGFADIVKRVAKKGTISSLAISSWSVGTVICAGTKENFLLLLLPNIALLAYLMIKKHITAYFSVWFVVTTFFILFIGTAISIATLKVGNDIYGATVSPTSRTRILFTGVKHSESKKIVGFVAIAVAFIGMYHFKKAKDYAVLKALSVFVVIGLGCAAVFWSQYLFYNGDWPNGSRYDFPGIIVIPFFYLSLLYTLYWILKELAIAREVYSGLWYGAVCGLVLMTVMRGFVATEVRVADNVRNTKLFTERIETMSKKLKENPEIPLVVESGGPWDFEPVYSYEKFLRAYGVTNDMYVRTHNYSVDSVAEGLEKQLATSIINIQKNGNGAYKALPAQLSNCYSLALTKVTTNECTEL